jgi:hypothetical protein
VRGKKEGRKANNEDRRRLENYKNTHKQEEEKRKRRKGLKENFLTAGKKDFPFQTHSTASFSFRRANF